MVYHGIIWHYLTLSDYLAVSEGDRKRKKKKKEKVYIETYI